MKNLIKNLLLFSLTLFLFISCGSHPAKKMRNILKAFPIGTSETKFNNELKGQELVYSNGKHSAYRVVVSTYNYFHDRRSDYRFFYFTDGYLTRIDKGERKVDNRIKIDN